MRYDFQQNEWGNYNFAHLPTTWLSYKDASGDQQLIFGDKDGQCYTCGGSSLNDNGSSIATVIEFVVSGGVPESDKEWKYFWAFFKSYKRPPYKGYNGGCCLCNV